MIICLRHEICRSYFLLLISEEGNVLNLGVLFNPESLASVAAKFRQVNLYMFPSSGEKKDNSKY